MDQREGQKNVLLEEKKKSIEVYSPMNGRFVSLDEVPDQVFSQGMMGEGFAVDPVGGKWFPRSMAK